MSSSFIKPMLATLVDAAFDNYEWVFEAKWDGYRTIAIKDGDRIDLYSRCRKSFNKAFPEIMMSLKTLVHDAILDGEIVVVDPLGKSSLRLLKDYRKIQQGLLLYYVFDCLELGGVPLVNLPLMERKARLRELLPNLDNVRYTEHVEGEGIRMLEAITANGFEGVIAKRAQSQYRPGIRSRDWLKIKTPQRLKINPGKPTFRLIRNPNPPLSSTIFSPTSSSSGRSSGVCGIFPLLDLIRIARSKRS